MGKKTIDKISVLVLIISLLLGMTNTGLPVKADVKQNTEEEIVVFEAASEVATGGGAEATATATAEPTATATAEPTATPDNSIVITPFAGQWKYYGQTRKLIQDIHYGVSNDQALPENVRLTIASEEVGKHSYVLVDEREVKEPPYRLADNAPTYEIKEYKTTAKATATEEVINIADRAELTDDKTVVTAPAGYKISQSIGEDADWKNKISVTLTDGKNEIPYYLSSNKDDDTKKAIDQTKKTIVVSTDWTAPDVTSVTGGDNSTDISSSGQITGSEAGKFYYIVLPKHVADEEEAKAEESGPSSGITADYIQNRVASHYGIVGYGRVDGVKASDFSFNGLMAETEYVIYSYMVDDAGNESTVKKSDGFTTDQIALAGSVTISGTVAVDGTLTAKANLDSVAPGELTYQWYRIKNSEDAASFESVLDETGGAAEDDLEAEDDGDEDEDEEEDDDNTYELDRVHKWASSDVDEAIRVDGATLITGATSATYKVTRNDIGYRLICSVKAKNYSDYVAGESTTYVPKLIPQITLPTISSAVYSPTRKLSSIRLPERFSWIDNTIVPVYGNSGYRVKYIPQNTAIYRTVIVRVKVPVQKKTLTKSMIKIKKTHSYTGKAIKNNFYLKDGSEELEAGKDYKATYSNNKKLGKATITIKGAGNYKGTKKVSYTIVKRSVKSLTYRYKKTKVYNGKPKTASVVVKNGSVKLVKDKDYTIKYKNNTNLGTATVTIRGKGNYKGKKVLHFQIVPSKPKITKVTKKKKSFRLQLSAGKIAKGYIVYVSTASSFAKKKTQQYSTTGNHFGMQGLVKGTYYVRAKCYGVKKGKTYKSSYSKVRKIKIK